MQSVTNIRGYIRIMVGKIVAVACSDNSIYLIKSNRDKYEISEKRRFTLIGNLGISSRRMKWPKIEEGLNTFKSKDIDEYKSLIQDLILVVWTINKKVICWES